MVGESRAAIGMVLIQVASAGMNILYKMATSDGMKSRILVTYRLLFATAFMFPLALILERTKRPTFTWRLLSLSFISGLLGTTLTNGLHLASLALTSATFTTAVGILSPAFTFIIAVLFGLENLRLGSKDGNAKVAGTLLGIAGALVFTFYHGVEIPLWSTHVYLLGHGGGGHVAPSLAGSGPFFLGALMALGGNFCCAFWLLLLAKTGKLYKGYYWNTALMCLMGSLQTLAFALCTETEWKEWKLGWNIRLITAVYSGIVNSGLVVVLLTWCIRLKGPLFASAFSPLSLVIVALFGSFALDENLHLGSVIGTVLIIGGLYMVLWGKTEETNDASYIKS